MGLAFSPHTFTSFPHHSVTGELSESGKHVLSNTRVAVGVDIGEFVAELQRNFMDDYSLVKKARCVPFLPASIAQFR